MSFDGNVFLAVECHQITASQNKKGDMMAEYENIDTTKTVTILAQDVEIKGTVTFKSSLTINGILDGEVASEGTLVVNPTARVTATIATRDYVSFGEVEGDVTASGQITLKKGSVHTGNLVTSKIEIEPGANFNGSLTMNKQGR
jgi:cytoskeletal protein CcmA (bactofilin family)